MPHKLAAMRYPSNPRGYLHELHQLGPLDVSMFAYFQPPESTMHVVPSREDFGTVTIRTNSIAADIARPRVINQSQIPVVKDKSYRLTFATREPAAGVQHVSVFLDGDLPGPPLLDDRFSSTSEWKTYEAIFTPPRDGLATLNFDLGPDAREFELGRVRLDPLEAGADLGKTEYFVRHVCNDHGFRDFDRAIEPKQGVLRIACLGDSFIYGLGVHFEDLLTVRLERLLQSDARLAGRPVEVLNFGVCGYGTAQERMLYEEVVRTYRPEVVLLFMVDNDSLVMHPAHAPGELRLLGPWDRTFYTIRLARNFRWNAQVRTYQECIASIRLLNEHCRHDGARLGVTYFRNTDLASWNALIQDVDRGLKGSGIPTVDLGKTLLRGRRPADLGIHPNDSHPNEVAQRLAAEAVRGFLFDAQLLVPESPPAAESPGELSVE